LVGRRIAVKLDKRVLDLEAKGTGTALKKCHLVGLGQGTEDEAIDAYGRDLIGPDDMIILLVGMDRAAEYDPVDPTPG
jgi:hypothetical protein